MVKFAARVLARTPNTNPQVPNVVFQNPRQRQQKRKANYNYERRRKACERSEDPKTTARDTLLMTTIATMRDNFGRGGWSVRGKNHEPVNDPLST